MADLRKSILITIDDDHEGGFQDDYNDHANWTLGKVGAGFLVGTKYGITAQDMPGRVIKDLTPDDAIKYYEEHYVKTLYPQILDQTFANKLLDMGVLFGIGTAVSAAQTALQIEVDGDFGPETLQHVNAAEPKSLLMAFQTVLVRRALEIGAKNPDERQFVSGWIRRINLADPK